MRVVGSAHADPFSSTAAACAALYGPLHGGANEAVVRMLTEIGSLENISPYLAAVEEGKAPLMGFGPRGYKSYHPPAPALKDTPQKGFQGTGRNPLLPI